MGFGEVTHGRSSGASSQQGGKRRATFPHGSRPAGLCPEDSSSSHPHRVQTLQTAPAAHPGPNPRRLHGPGMEDEEQGRGPGGGLHAAARGGLASDYCWLFNPAPSVLDFFFTPLSSSH